MSDVVDETKVDEVPFDLYGELEDAYDEAERNGEKEVVETLDTFGLWDESPKCNRAFMRRIWRALNGDAEAQADVGHAFFWKDDDPHAEKYKWLDKPLLAIYWYEFAAEAGLGDAQWDLAHLYCPMQSPDHSHKLGRMARGWLEEAAAQKVHGAMCDLAFCLRCGKCGPACDRDIPRAEALEREIKDMEKEEVQR